ncbi:hypothetical protein [Sinorhizobium meliloti]|uniref:hypothetical protein n=1 Tax=Rhizobium meliloti TaxID=382 RepID=UPI000FD7B325|nr:hypothetical protein [Sinorhizobium meliloti]RVG94506.1 hypothetical protein CN210_33230 [Sinorhizobium meliloti]
MTFYTRDYPSRETALAIIEALKTADEWSEVGQITGITGDAQYIANRCFMIYGYPELEPTALAQWTAEAFDRRHPKGGPRARRDQPQSTSTAAPSSPVDTYGFSPRD